MDTDDLSTVLADTTAVMFDFDGPICDVFGGRPAAQVAKELAELAVRSSPALSRKLWSTDDPLEVLRLTHEADTGIGLQVEHALTAAEIEAVGVAGAPTPGAVASLEAVRATGRKIAVVSNNSAECVRVFLDQHGLAGHVLEVVGRPEKQPELMKPNPHSLVTAAERLGVDITLCALIGDSLTDIQAAHAVGSAAIGYANKSRKRQVFAESGAEAIIESMQAIADAIRPLPSN
ncbi:HAD hydrolase-like protein [Streptomyces sp. NBC_01321]|uniref:HAD family hydrolase n=1 Tax=Streptomyces sp. NBC_01321 TaxID=2903825 RepID=UPI002E13B478|nr:HAD hydrolase-like protein [Streptomyces sp. NBC_01321]